VARPREHSDEELLDLVGQALARRTALSRWSLAEVAREVGVAPATFVKRFGSRHGLLAALSWRWIDSIPARPSGVDPLDELTAWVTQICSSTRGRAAALVGLRFLMEDVVDDELAGLLVTGWTKQVDYLAALLGETGWTGLGNSRECAQLLFDALNGSVLRAAAGDPGAPDALETMRSLVGLWT
jgi:AcrR family transcriptional regulator